VKLASLALMACAAYAQLNGVIDIHVHADPDSVARSIDAIDVARLAKERGMRALVLKNHYESTASLAYVVRKVVPGIEIFGGIDLNRSVGGVNPAAIERMVMVKGGYGRVVWLPTFDAENQVRFSKENRPFVAVSKNGALLPEVKEVTSNTGSATLRLTRSNTSSPNSTTASGGWTSLASRRRSSRISRSPAYGRPARYPTPPGSGTPTRRFGSEDSSFMMVPVLTRAIFAAVMTWEAFGQALPAPPAFEVVSIKAAPSQEPGRTSTRMSTDPARLAYTNVTLIDVLAQAYHVQHVQLSGPGWMDTERFDIFAKIPEGVPTKQIPQMLQALLADRFKVKLHSETKVLPVYVLEVGKAGPKIQKAGSSGGLSIGSSSGHVHLKGNVSMPWLADYLSTRLGSPLQDQTQLEGPYAIALDWVPDAAGDAATGPSLSAAVQEQLGLKLVATKAPVEVFVIDHVERVPTGN
jgi:uncharacterized protein (TIGR03435 family)